MTEEELDTKVREMRGRGATPKEIARTLGVRKARVTQIVQQIAHEERQGDDGMPRLVGCWVSPGWDNGLVLDDDCPEWPRRETSDGTGGAVTILTARAHRGRRITVCSYLVDVWCLGIKNALGPRIIDESELRGFVTNAFGAYADPPLEAPLELACELVFGAVEFARGLGIEPHPDLEPAREHLGPWIGPSVIGFGHNGKPLYIEGPYDDTLRILATIRSTVGDEGFNYSILAGGDPLAVAA